MDTQNPNNTATAKHNMFSQFKWAESYTSLLLGIFVVILAGVILVLFARNRHIQKVTQPNQVAVKPHTLQKTETKPLTNTTQKTAAQSNPQNPAQPELMQNKNNTTYTIKSGDSLWNIAVETTGSGYNWVKIAQANKLMNPGIIHSGNILIIPCITQPQITQQPQLSPIMTQTPGTNSITGYEYTVQKDDTLWNIAERSYGDGFKWIQIARANNLANPGLIHIGNVLKIPRPKVL